MQRVDMASRNGREMMKRNTPCMTAVLMAMALAAPALAGAQQQQGSNMESMMEQMQAMAREATTPGDHHEALGRFLGDWNVEFAMVMPSVPEQRSQGSATYEWLIEGRWLAQRIQGEMMGSDYESFSIIGFDNFAKNHVVMTVSSMDTAMNMARGLVVDPEGKVTSVYGTLDEYTTGEFHKPFKVVTRIHDADRHVMEIWDLAIGADGAKVLELTFTRNGS